MASGNRLEKNGSEGMVEKRLGGLKNARTREDGFAHGPSLHARNENLTAELEARSEKLVSLLGYTNDDNPFGDTNLTKQFEWAKKGKKKSRKRREFGERLEELESVRKRRDEREERREESRKRRNEESQKKEREMLQDIARKEEGADSILDKQRSRLRIKRKRARTMDKIYQNMLLLEEQETSLNVIEKSLRISGIIMPEKRTPVELLGECHKDDIENVLKTAKAFILKDVDKSFWTPIVCLIEARQKKQRIKESVSDFERLEKAVESLVRNQPRVELESIRNKVHCEKLLKKPGSDFAYWNLVLAQVDEILISEEICREHEKLLRKLERKISHNFENDAMEQSQLNSANEVLLGSRSCIHNATLEKSQDDIEVARISNVASTNQEDHQLLDDEDFEEQMAETEELVLPTDTSSSLSGIPLKKPKFFNKVQTGYDWNNYNRTHYDSENPPPKTVQGYKFHIHYPELPNQSRAPRYSIEAADTPEFAVLRFHAGPPYADIAFRIVNCEWRKGKHSGFRWLFQDGQAQLHFNLKRYQYRR